MCIIINIAETWMKVKGFILTLWFLFNYIFWWTSILDEWNGSLETSSSKSDARTETLANSIKHLGNCPVINVQVTRLPVNMVSHSRPILTMWKGFWALYRVMGWVHCCWTYSSKWSCRLLPTPERGGRQSGLTVSTEEMIVWSHTSISWKTF